MNFVVKASFYSKISENLELEGLYNVIPEQSSRTLGDKLESCWNEELKDSSNKKSQPSLLKATWNAFGWLFCYYGIHVFIICVILRGLQPYILGLLIRSFDPRSNSTKEEACIYASALIIMIVLQAIVGHHSVVGRKEVGMKMSIAYSALIFRKILRLSITTSNKYDTGMIINLLSNDVGKFEDVCMFLHYIWVLPIQGLLMAYFIWNNVGIASLAGILILAIQTIPVQGYLGKVTAKVRAKVAGKTDERVRLMSEIIKGIRVIKIYTWEKPFENLVFLARKCEVDTIAIKSYLRGLSTATSAFAESTSLFFIILTYVLLGNILEASIVYSVAQYFAMIKTMMTVFYPRAISSAAEARVSIERIEFLKMTDEPYAVNVIESDSLWERIKTIGSRPIFIAAAVIGVLLLAIVTTIIVVLTRDKSDPGNLAIDYSKALIVSDDHYLWALDLNSQEKKLLVRTIWGISAFDIYRKNTIYWHEYRSNYVNSLSEKYHNLTQTRKWEPVSIAMDWVTEKVYVLDYLAGKLNVYDTMSTSYGIAVADLKNPVDLALDPTRGLMFIVQKSDSILKGNMDGTSIEKIITSSSVTAIALDTQTPKLYFSDADKIESSDYFGNQRQTVTRLSSSTTTLGVSGNRLFWTKVTRSLGTRSLWSCTLTNNNCDEKDLQQISFDDPVTIKVYTGSGLIVANPCENDNGGCDQLCLLKANNERSCGCYIGYKLQDDGKNCELVNEYILYTRGNLVRGRILDPKKEAFTDAIAPFLIEKTVLDDKKTIDFDYNFYTNTLAYSDDNNVGTTNLLKEDEGTYSRDKCLKSVSYDWVTNDIYYIKDNCNTTDNTTIVVMKPNQESYFWKTMHTFQATIGHPKALVVHPNRGGYYFTIKRKGSAQIYKGHGLKTRPFLEQLDVNETALAIDYVEDRLYWFSQDMTKLYNADLKGTDIKSIDISIIKNPTSISAHQRYAYVSNLTNIWRFDTFNGSGRIKLVPKLNDDSESLISGVKIYSPMVQSVDTNNLCAIENGQCEQFCFREPKKIVTGPNAVDVTDELHKVCVCEDFKSIRADGRTCS